MGEVVVQSICRVGDDIMRGEDGTGVVLLVEPGDP